MVLNRFRLALMAAAALGISACTTHSGPMQQARLQQMDGPGCLSGGIEKLDHFVAGTLSDTELAGFWDCADSALELFAARTRGARPGAYSAEELRTFLQTYFVRDVPITDGLLHEAMALKQAVLGGDAAALTLDEIGRTRALIALLKAETRSLRPLMPLTADRWADAEPKALDEAIAAVEASAGRLGDFLARTAQPYTLNQFNSLVIEAWNDSREGMTREDLAELSRRVPLARALKAILLPPDADTIGVNDWKPLLVAGARAYGIYLRALNLGRFDSLTAGDGRERLLTVATGALSLARGALARHPGGAIPYAELDALLDGLFPEGGARISGYWVPVAHLKDALRPALGKILGDDNHDLRHRRSAGLESATLDAARATLLRWSEGQRFLEALFGAAEGVSTDPSAYGPRIAQDLLEGGGLALFLGAPAPEPAIRDTVAKDLSAELPKLHALFAGSDSRIFFGPASSARLLSFHDVSQMNLLRTISRLLMAGYAHDYGRAITQSGVTLKEFREANDDIGDIGLDVDVLTKPADPMRADKRFMEANLFTYAANGDNQVDLEEGWQLLAFMLSGEVTAKAAHAEIAKVCPAEGQDSFGTPYVNAECYRQAYFGRFEHYWDHLPGLAAAYRALPEAARADFRRTYEMAARKRGYSPAPFSDDDSQCFAALGQYVEAVFTRFDTDQSGTLDLNEARAMFPLVRPTLETLSGLHSEGSLWALFTYFLATGQPPSRDVIGGLSFLMWRENAPFWRVQADRLKILHVFATISALDNGR